MKMGIKALLSAPVLGICLAVVGCNPEEAPPATTPPPAATAPGAPGEAPKEAAPSVEAPKEAAPAVEPAKEAPKAP